MNGPTYAVYEIKPNKNKNIKPNVVIFIYVVCVCKFTHCIINGRLYAAAFTYPHLTHKVLSLFNADLPNASFSRNLPTHRWTRIYCINPLKPKRERERSEG
jgi:hypothetical protein